MKLAKKFGAAVIALTIDEVGMAKTAEDKLRIAERLVDFACTQYGLPQSDLMIDPLTFTIATGNEDDRKLGVWTLDGIRMIREKFPDIQIILGLSNISFGLNPAARHVLNSVFLDHAVKAGMTGAIVHVSKIKPLHQIPPEEVQVMEDLIYDRRAEGYDPLQKVLEMFSGRKAADNVAKVKAATVQGRLKDRIVDGDRKGLETELADAMEEGMTPLAIINDVLLDGMKVVGELFGAGKMQLPFVLQSAETMKAAVAYLEPHMERVEGQEKGIIVLGTVRGDVHDIGKNLVDIILTNNGYTVHNIGIKQPINDIIDALERTRADAIGLSGLLVKSVHVMEENLNELNARGIAVPVLLGGAALTRTYAEGHLKSVYRGPLYYGKDAFEGLAIMDRLRSGKAAEIDSQVAERQAKRAAALERVAAGCVGGVSLEVAGAELDDSVRSDVGRGADAPAVQAPFLGSRVVSSVSLKEVFSLINPTALYAVQWQIKRGTKSKAEYESQLDEVARPVFKRLCAEAEREGILTPKVAYGYFPCRSEGNAVVIFDPVDHTREIERLVFPRQPQGRRLCIADFFRDADECERAGSLDVIGMSCVTMGERISEHCKRLFDAGAYQDYLYWHGLGVEAAEGLAELWHKRMRQELGIAGQDDPTPAGLFKQGYRGSRYSFGYPACPDMTGHEVIWRLIDPTRIGCTLTENHQIVPEQSTSAIVVHHPEARYFNA